MVAVTRRRNNVIRNQNHIKKQRYQNQPRSRRWQSLGCTMLCLCFAAALLFAVPFLRNLSTGALRGGRKDDAVSHLDPAKSEDDYNNNKDKNENKVKGAVTNEEEEVIDSLGVIDAIVAGRLHLIKVSTDHNNNYDDDDNQGRKNPLDAMVGTFCRLDWDKHKGNPANFPMFKTLVEASNCNEHKNVEKANLGTVMRAIVEYDNKTNNEDGNNHAHNLNISGLVFHESRCGSTLVSNVLVAADPRTHRVYSESQPPTTAMKACQKLNCKPSQTASVLRDVMTIMSRSDDPNETKVFFKLQSINSLPDRLSALLEAVPEVPWIYVFRDPVQVIMSHLGCKGGNCKDRNHQNANCVRQSKSSRPFFELLFQEVGVTSIDAQLSPNQPERTCAAHLGSLTASASRHMNSKGLPVEYDAAGLFQNLVTNVLPLHFGVHVVDLSKEENKENPQAVRLQAVGGVYSKGGQPQHVGTDKDVTHSFQSDSAAKEAGASEAIKEAARRFMDPSFQSLKKTASQKQEELETKVIRI